MEAGGAVHALETTSMPLNRSVHKHSTASIEAGAGSLLVGVVSQDGEFDPGSDTQKKQLIRSEKKRGGPNRQPFKRLWSTIAGARRSVLSELGGAPADEQPVDEQQMSLLQLQGLQ